MNANSKRQFLGGAMALTLSTALVKIIGMVYKIPLMHLLGAEGMGCFNSAYETYTLFFVISTSGIPVAISIMISEGLASGKLKNVGKIYVSSLWLLMFIGTLGALTMSFGADIIARAIGSEKAAYALVAVAPTVLFISVSSAVRGYFQGCGNMLPTAVSQIVESVGKLVLGLGFALAAKNCGLPDEKVAAFAILGLTVGTALSMLYLCISKFRAKLTLEYRVIETECDKNGVPLTRLVKLAIPVTLSSMLVSVTRMVDMTVLLHRLPDEAERLALYGAYSTMALPVANLPSSLVAGIALALVPAITAAGQSRNSQREDQLISSGLRLCATVAIPASFGISIYSEQILGVLFTDEREAIAVSSPLLSLLGLSVLAACLVQVCNSVLQANGKIALPIFSMLAGVAVKLVSSYILVGMPQIGAMGAPISTFFCNLTAVALNLRFLDKYTGFRTRLSKIFVKPLAFSSLSALASVGLYTLFVARVESESVAFFVAAACFAAVYFALLMLGGGFDGDELDIISFGNKIKKIRLIKRT